MRNRLSAISGILGPPERLEGANSVSDKWKMMLAFSAKTTIEVKMMMGGVEINVDWGLSLLTAPIAVKNPKRIRGRRIGLRKELLAVPEFELEWGISQESRDLLSTLFSHKSVHNDATCGCGGNTGE